MFCYKKIATKSFRSQIPREARTKGFFFFVSHLLLQLRPSKMVLCFCGNVVVVRTSWTSRNPGRRFYACPKMVRKFILDYDISVVMQ
uniref:GRF-type domain-containing protein n=1 Tax=Lactuca sativa TaxID=4236 RepID=A0A9R1X293_LACSA|nr:hypothetical protein LSAT_V11C800404450 [Lactuca sativa]